jgi:hypothetical protein
VVEEDGDVDRVARIDSDSVDARPTRCEVVESRCGNELLVASDERARFDGVQHEVPEEDLVRVDIDLARQELAERSRLGLADAPHRHEVLLRVQLETLAVDLPIEMDRELRDASDRPVDVHELDATAAQRHAARKTEVAVEPRVEQRASVDLDCEQLHAGAFDVGLRLHPQVRAVGVRADDAKRRRCGCVLRNRPRDQAPVAHEVVAHAVSRGPFGGFVDLGESRSFEERSGGRARMERGRRVVDEGQEGAGRVELSGVHHRSDSGSALRSVRTRGAGRWHSTADC